MTGVFEPATTTVPSPAPSFYACNEYVQIANSVTIGTYQSYTWQILIYNSKGQLIDGGTFNTIDAPYTPESQISDIQAVCSDNLHACPTLEILSGSSIISSPQPTPTAVVGERQSVTMKQVPNSGKAGPYTLASPMWSPPAQAIKNYTLALQTSAPKPVLLTTTDLQKTSLNFYMTDPTKSAVLQAFATLTSATETASVGAITAYDLLAPPMTWTSVTHPVQAGDYPLPQPTGTPLIIIALSLGKPIAGGEGIIWTVTAPTSPTPLPGVAGTMDVLQTINSQQSTIPQGCQGILPTSGTELDYLINSPTVWYDNASAVSIARVWTLDDSPATQLATPSPCTSLSRSDTFVDTLMFKSDKSNSIWTPIMVFGWDWSGTAVYKDGWTLGTNTWSANPQGAPAYAFPTWKGLFSGAN